MVRPQALNFNDGFRELIELQSEPGSGAVLT
jgi:hypothetical protein